MCAQKRQCDGTQWAPDLVGLSTADGSRCELSLNARMSNQDSCWHRPCAAHIREDLTLLGLTALLEHAMVERALCV